MALNLSGYVDPGTYVSEVVTPAAISIATVPDILAIVATGNKSKRSTNETIKRGQILQEALTLSGSAPYIGTLVNRGDRRISNTTVRRTLNTQILEIPDSAVSYLATSLSGNAAGPFDISTNKAIGFKMDAGSEITIQLAYSAAPVAPVISGSYIVVQYAFSGVGGNAATRAQVVAAINTALAAAGSLGYGAAYAAVASDITTGIKFTSPISTVDSDVQILKPAGLDGTTLFGFAVTPALAVTKIEIDGAYYDAAATWEIDYVATNTDLDSLENAATKIIRVGSYAGVTSFLSMTDYELTGGDIDWSPNSTAVFTGLVGTYNLGTVDTIKIALDGKAAVQIDLNGLASPPLNYTNPAAPAATTAAEVAKNINAVLSTAANYGPRYATVATDVGGAVKLTSPDQGIVSSIEISTPSTANATQVIFGLTTGQLPYTEIGAGNKPSVGVLYFATYEYDRALTEYNVPKRFFSEDQMVQDLGPVAYENVLSTYGQIAFENGAPSIFTCQVYDTIPGAPTVNEVKAAIDGLSQSSLITDVCVADTRLNVQTYLQQHIEDQSSPTEKNYRCAWFGMPVGTVIGDKDTPNSFVYRSAVTLQVMPDSTARGRLYLVGPTNVDRVITLEDGSETTLNLDSTAVAAAVAARHTSFTSPAVSLASKNVVGFDVNTFPTYLRGERAQLASNGVLVVTLDGGRLSILDPVSTEAGGGNLTKFLFRSCASQKDNVSRSVTKVVDTNLRGVVPDDLADFIFDIKAFVGQSLIALIQGGAIGPFRDNNGVSRDIDLSRDVQAQQSTTDPTKFLFRYNFYLRYPALRFLGEFSVDNPFFNV